STYAATCVTSSHAMSFFFFISLQASSTSEIYTLSLHDALPIFAKSLVGFERIDGLGARGRYTLAAGHLQLDFAGDEHDGEDVTGDRKSTRLNSSHVSISYAVFCLKKKKKAETGFGYP